MLKLTLGVLLWSGTHLIPALAVGVRKRLVDRLGEHGYKGLFVASMVLAIYLIISGWKATLPEFVYIPPTWGRHAAALVVLIAFVLFSASHGNNNIKRFVRHPQLSSVVLWGLAHLLANGESRSIVLFGGLTLWAVIQTVLINRRDGAWVKPDPAPRRKDVIAVVAGVVVYAIFAHLHLWLFGVSPFA
jgi:uncharacterized membrane protein